MLLIFSLYSSFNLKRLRKFFRFDGNVSRLSSAISATYGSFGTVVFSFFYESDQSFDYYKSICTSCTARISDNAKKLSLERHQRVQMKVGEGIFTRHGRINDIALWERIWNAQIHRGISFENKNFSKAHTYYLSREAVCVSPAAEHSKERQKSVSKLGRT